MTASKPIPSPKLLIDQREAARLLTVCEPTIRNLTKSGNLPCIRIGRLVRYSPADLVAWIESQRTVCA